MKEFEKKRDDKEYVDVRSILFPFLDITMIIHPFNSRSFSLSFKSSTTSSSRMLNLYFLFSSVLNFSLWFGVRKVKGTTD